MPLRRRSIAYIELRTYCYSMTEKHTTTWADLAISLYDKLTERNAEITYDFDDLDVSVPSGTGDGATHAHWKINGTIKVSTRDRS
jgi:hypothetical protein